MSIRKLTGRKSAQVLFAGRGDGARGLTTRQYARLVQEWVARRLMVSTIPDLHTKLQVRHKKLCAIYAHARKRARATIADSLPQQSVGRNDPCPCGSGKKFKKCCMGQNLRGADTRRTESTITIRR